MTPLSYFYLIVELNPRGKSEVYFRGLPQALSIVPDAQHAKILFYFSETLSICDGISITPLLLKPF